MRFAATIILLTCFSVSLSAGVLQHCPKAETMPGWTYEFEPEIFTPENLHDYIDGEAELYKKYDFREMVTATYVSEENPGLDFTIDIYDMGAPLNAFGVYSLRRRPDMTFAEIGEEATLSEMMIRFWQGRFYVQTVAGGVDSIVSEAIKTTAEDISTALPGGGRPAALALLPAKNQQPHTLTYQRDSSINGQKCSRLLQANYKSTGSSWIGFVLLFDDADKARQWLQRTQPRPDVLLKMKTANIFGVTNFTDKKAAELFLEQAAARSIKENKRRDEGTDNFGN